MKIAHTPTPWTLEWECEDTGVLKDANGEHITHIDGSRYFDDRQDGIAHENAAFIVKAVNCHDELVEALQLAHDQLSNYEPVAPLIKKVLAKAKESR